MAALLALEGTLARRGRDALFDRTVSRPADWWDARDAVDVLIDCSGDEDAGRGAPVAPVLRPLFDGQPSEAALISALLAGALPEIAVVDGRRCLASGRPSGEAGGGLTGGLDAVLSRAMVLIEGLVAAPRRPEPRPVPEIRRHAPRHPGSVLLRGLSRDAARAAYRLCVLTPHWRVGWRHNDGPGVLERRDLDGPAWRTLPDAGHRFLADPFPVAWRGREVIFAEELDHRTGKGSIAAVEIAGGVPRPAITVLEEPWHLSYPFLIEEDGQLYMVPEASLSGEVALYRCLDFPARWERCATLLGEIEAADATIFRHGGRHWMTAVTRDGRGGYSDILRIWHAPALLGPWEEHGLRPVAVDAGTARPAGAVVASDGHLWRPFQDCAEGYGRALGLARIDRLDPDHFNETVVARLRPGPRWPGRRIHTLNRAGRLECIDGSATMPRLPALRPWAAARLRPRPGSLKEPAPAAAMST